jgi:hypothetical protein
MAANRLLPKPERPRGIGDLITVREKAQNSKLARRQHGCLASAANLRWNELLKADGRKCRTHE